MKPTRPAAPSEPSAEPKPAFTHNINSLSLELTIAKPLQNRGDWSTVFAIHNKFVGEAPPRAIPLNLTFNGRSHKRAAKIVEVGTRLVVHGSLHFAEGETRDFYSIQVDDFTLCGQAARKPETSN